MVLGRKGLVMKIRELIEVLQGYDQDLEIVAVNYDYRYDDKNECIEVTDAQYFEPVIEFWDERNKDLVQINHGDLISG